MQANIPPQFRSDWSADCFVGSAAIVNFERSFEQVIREGRCNIHRREE
jgi:hypothetical protein